MAHKKQEQVDSKSLFYKGKWHEAHLTSEQQRNFAQSNHYQVVDDIVSKLGFDYKNCKCPGKSEYKEKLELQHTPQKDIRENNVQLLDQGFLCKETQ